MNLPPHNARYCMSPGCVGTIEKDSIFPFCPTHLRELQTGKRHNGCAGAITFDSTMRPHQTSCNNATGHPEERLCPSCRVIERREKDRARSALREPCPHCGQSMPRSRAPLAVPPRSMQEPRPSFQTNRRPPPTRYPSRPQAQPAQFQWQGSPVPKYEPEEE